MKKLFALGIVFFACAVSAMSQTCQEQPQNCVLITREASIKALEDSDRVKALEAEVIVLKQAVNDQREITTNLKVELGKAMGELTGSQQMNVRQTAIIDVLLKNVRPKKFGIINF